VKLQKKLGYSALQTDRRLHPTKSYIGKPNFFLSQTEKGRRIRGRLANRVRGRLPIAPTIEYLQQGVRKEVIDEKLAI